MHGAERNSEGQVNFFAQLSEDDPHYALPAGQKNSKQRLLPL